MVLERGKLAMKVDLVMWSKHGPRESVLKRISDVIPEQNVNQRFLVVDSLSDIKDTSYTKYQWTLLLNDGKAISGASNTALRRVKTEFFVSFEDDILLAENWWRKIPPHMDDPRVVTAQGIRVATHPTLRRLAEYAYRNNRKALGGSVDNNLFRTTLLRELGGFSKKDPLFVDYTLCQAVSGSAYKWIVDETVVSYHIRTSVSQAIRHGYQQEMLSTSKRENTSFRSVFRSAITSPFSGINIAVKTRCPQIVVVYPRLRFASLKTFLHKRGR